MLPESVRTKIKNITGKAPVSALCGAVRVAKRSRFTMPYSDLGSLTLEDLKTITNGIVVILENGDYLQMQNSKSKLDQYLLANIGGDDNVAAILGFYSVGGTSGSARAMTVYKQMEPIIAEKKWMPLERKSGIPRGQTFLGNQWWRGHYYTNVRGGSTTSRAQTHCSVNGALPAKFQLFNSVGGYLDKTAGIHLTSSMLYMMLHSVGIAADEETQLDPVSLSRFKGHYEELLAQVRYDSGGCLDWCQKFIHKEHLICPLEANHIPFQYFKITKCTHHNHMQLCHNEAASKKKYFQDRVTNTFVSDFRPNNLFWGTHQGNMEQQDMTIEEYHRAMRAKVQRLDKIWLPAS